MSTGSSAGDDVSRETGSGADARCATRHSSGQFMSADGVRLHLQAWLPAGDAPGAPAPDVRAVVAVVHGYGDHGGRYTWLGEDLAARGHALYAYDLRGHGHSSGERGQVGRFDEYLDDTEAFLDEVRKAQPGKTLFLLGHSMGGLICARLAEERPPAVRGLILSSPFLQLAEAVPPSRLYALKVLARVWRDRDIGNTVRAEHLSHDEAVVSAYTTDRLVHHVAPARWASQMLAAQDATMADASKILLPLLTLYGTEDQVVDTAFVEALYADAESEDKTIHRYEGYYHECFNETGRERVFDDLAAWLAARLPGAG
ncbi:MAG TPA: lysophospholipase [Thermoleophilia bacterium]|nr:lysophospholipase [Thermoleophilia bacterium]